MRRGYSRESYLELVEHVKNIIPNVRLSGDMIAGFCGETEEEFEETMSLIEKVRFGNLFCFAYSMREVRISQCGSLIIFLTMWKLQNSTLAKKYSVKSAYSFICH